MYEIVFTIDGSTSWMYFGSTPAKYKADGEKKFKQVVRDSGWTKRAKLVKIKPMTKAVDPPLTKAQKDAVRQTKRARPSNNTRRARPTRVNKPKSRKVS